MIKLFPTGLSNGSIRAHTHQIPNIKSETLINDIDLVFIIAPRLQRSFAVLTCVKICHRIIIIFRDCSGIRCIM